MFPSWFPKSGPTPCSCRAYKLMVCLPVFHLHIPTCGSGAVKPLTGGERSQRVHAALGKPGLTPRLHLYGAEGEAVRAELFPSAEKQWPAGLYNMPVRAPVALSSHTACRTGCREEHGRRAKVGRMGIAGNMDQSWNCCAFLQWYCRKADLISCISHRSACYNDF